MNDSEPKQRPSRKAEEIVVFGKGGRRNTGWIIGSIIGLVALGYVAVLFFGGQALRDLPGAGGIQRLREGLEGLGEAGPPALADLPPLLQNGGASPTSSPIEVILSPPPGASPQPSLSPVAVAPRPEDPSIVTFTIEFENTTGVRLTGVQITDRIPSGTSYRGGSANPDASFDGSQLVWNIGTLDPGEGGRVSFQVLTRTTGRITNRAVLTSNEAPPGTIESSTNV
ncbi:MAG TPA: hypothetical protein VND22_07820 [Actinomycetota bacterium]|nr:hypothetical protein [Actinomycetota bacterium]